MVRIPEERVGVLIGRRGEVKSKIEQACSIRMEIDSKSGEITLRADDVEKMLPFKAIEIIMAIGRGFSPLRAMKLLDENYALYIIDLREFAGKAQSQIERIKGRIIGEKGKARRNLERLSNTHISIYGRTVAIIGEPGDLKTAAEAVTALSSGRMHGAVYGKLESIKRKEKQDRMQLWENQDVF